jgi:hypothetical protein
MCSSSVVRDMIVVLFLEVLNSSGLGSVTPVKPSKNQILSSLLNILDEHNRNLRRQDGGEGSN